MKNTTVRLTLHNGEDVLVNWDTVAFATPSVAEQSRETFTKLVFTGNSSHEVDVRETLDEVNGILLNVNAPDVINPDAIKPDESVVKTAVKKKGK
ncbi:hypothetical protein CMI37_12250 [Candidatus Pacearchaeota archaeon]|nr:hypothetical protein [Candidatus Pacearchaeota archaeon]|tara:strand:+ start:234 stop:518 length:285 start_codon:yes stop_codon:yes gene_type:complete